MTTTDPRTLTRTCDGARRAWTVVEQMWEATFERATGLPEETLHERVNGEWSFVETQRHLIFVTDSWVRRTILGMADPYHRLGLPPDHKIGRPEAGVDVGAWGIDVFATASCGEVLEARLERMAGVREVINELGTNALSETCGANPAPGFPPSTTIPIGFCVDLVVGEEWAHHQFAERDLTTIEKR